MRSSMDLKFLGEQNLVIKMQMLVQNSTLLERWILKCTNTRQLHLTEFLWESATSVPFSTFVFCGDILQTEIIEISPLKQL